MIQCCGSSVCVARKLPKVYLLEDDYLVLLSWKVPELVLHVRRSNLDFCHCEDLSEKLSAQGQISICGVHHTIPLFLRSFFIPQFFLSLIRKSIFISIFQKSGDNQLRCIFILFRHPHLLKLLLRLCFLHFCSFSMTCVSLIFCRRIFIFSQTPRSRSLCWGLQQ